MTLVTPRYGNYMHEYSLAKVVSVKTHEVCKEMQSTLVVKALWSGMEWGDVILSGSLSGFIFVGGYALLAYFKTWSTVYWYL